MKLKLNLFYEIKSTSKWGSVSAQGFVIFSVHPRTYIPTSFCQSDRTTTTTSTARGDCTLSLFVGAGSWRLLTSLWLCTVLCVVWLCLYLQKNHWIIHILVNSYNKLPVVSLTRLKFILLLLGTTFLNIHPCFRFNLQKDEMEVEHLATLERLRQTQRQDYLKVMQYKLNLLPLTKCWLFLIPSGFRIRFGTGHRSANEGA